MPTSGTATFDLDILDLIEEAYELVGAEGRGGYDLRTARRSLNLMMQEWNNRGINFWTIQESSIPFTAGTNVASLDADTIDILDAVYRLPVQATTDRVMTRMSVDMWAQLANKTQPGIPNQFWVNRTVPPQVTIWPVPSESGTFVYWKMRRIQDVGVYTNNMDIPSRFLTAMTTGLAYYLAMKSPAAMERIPMLQAEYERQFTLASEEDRDRTSIHFVPDMSKYSC